LGREQGSSYEEGLERRGVGIGGLGKTEGRAKMGLERLW